MAARTFLPPPLFLGGFAGGGTAFFGAGERRGEGCCLPLEAALLFLLLLYSLMLSTSPVN